jgi:choline dehydrogenase-like flavoprotein
MGAPQLWASANRGGLTSVWGGGMLPFSDRELATWPLDAAVLTPYYRRVAEEVGVCGEHDAVEEYFGSTFVNRPPMTAGALAHALAEALGAEAVGGRGTRFIVGASRLALETRSGRDRTCGSLGECMLGCPRSAVWSASMTVGRLIAKLRANVVGGEVRSFDAERRIVVRQVDGTEGRHGPFDLVLLAAGAIGTTAIVLRSGARAAVAPLIDTALVSFPIVRLPGVRDPQPGHVALSNLTILAVPPDPLSRTLQLSVYPVFDHLFRYYLPTSLWPLAERTARAFRPSVLIGRAYLGRSADRSYRIQLVDGAPSIMPGTQPDVRPELRALIGDLRSALAGTGFRVPSLTTVQATSSHYGGTLPYGDPQFGVALDGAVAPGVHVADAAVFPDMPALSPTFTIMANACRTVMEALDAPDGIAS